MRIEPIFGGSLPDVSVSVNGVDMTERFRPAPADWLGRESDALLGLVDGLAVGDNTVVIEHAGTAVSSMTVTNYPVTGPLDTRPLGTHQRHSARANLHGTGHPTCSDRRGHSGIITARVESVKA